MNESAAKPSTDGPKFEPIPQYESAILHGNAAFSHLAESHFGYLPEFNADPVRRQMHKEYHPRLVQAFEAKHGRIVKIIYAEKCLAGAVLTETGELDLIYPLENTEIEKRFFRCERVQLQAQSFLNDSDRRICSDCLYSAATHLLDLLDSDKVDMEEKGQLWLFSTDEQIDHAEAFCHSAAQRHAQIQYFFGMTSGALILILAVLLFISIWSYFAGAPSLAVTSLVSSLVAGALGAILSVLSRMTADKLNLSYETGPYLIRLIGGFRPLVGAIFGATIYTCLASGLISFVALPPDPAKQVYLFCAVGVIAGFNERWAQDMLAIGSDRLRGKASSNRNARQTTTTPKPSLKKRSVKISTDETVSPTKGQAGAAL